MTSFSRRTFLGSAAATGVALGVGGIAAFADTRPGGTLDDVEHVVVLMQENRSFDHYFGALPGVRGFGDRSAVRFPNGANVFQQRNGSKVLMPWHLDTTTTDAQEVRDLDHGWPGTHSAWANGQYNNWVAAKTPFTMGYYTRADIPYQYALADAFTVCDQYFCSAMAPTNPNRMYLWTGTIDPAGRAGGPATDNSRTGLKWTTYPERLQQAGISWRVYQQQDNYDDNALAWFANFTGIPTDSPLYVNGMTRRGADAFAKDVAAGTLPAVSWVVAPANQSEHPDYPPVKGADFTATTVLNALAANPAVWAKTVVLLNFDENDGFFDHVVPPTAPAGTPDEFVNGAPIGLGPRVPMYVISPWSRGGKVCSEVFDHTSVLRFLENWTGVKETNISTWRRTVCGDLMSAFDFGAKNTTFPTLPDTAALLAALAQQQKLPKPTAPSTSAMPSTEPGDRPALPIGYSFTTTSWTETSTGRIWIKIANAGTLGAGFSMYAVNFRAFGAWQYTVPVGGSVQDFFSALSVSKGPYDVDAHGPDGYVRGFTGDVRTWSDAKKGHPEAFVVDQPGRTLLLTLTNDGGAAVTFTLTGAGTQQFQVAPGAKTTAVLQTAEGRYDYTVTADTGDSFSRRFTGRMYT